jgi:hypothetical protein
MILEIFYFVIIEIEVSFREVGVEIELAFAFVIVELVLGQLLLALLVWGIFGTNI